MAINLTVRTPEASDPVPEGLYQAKVTSIEEGDGSYGEYLKFSFEITEGEHAGVIKTAVASKKLTNSTSKPSKLYEFVKGITGDTPPAGTTFDIEELIGTFCQVWVENDKEVDGHTFQSVTKIRPAK